MKHNLQPFLVRLRSFSLTILAVLALSFSGAAQIISQYVETNAGTAPKGIEVWNNTSSSLDFATNNLAVRQSTNGGAPTTVVTVSTGSLAPGALLVIGTADIQTYLTSTGSTASFAQFNFTFNGDDGLSLVYGGVTTDMFGVFQDDPGTGWGTPAGVYTVNSNLQLLPGITTGDPDGWIDPSERFETVEYQPTNTPLISLTGFGVAPASAPVAAITATPSTLSGFTYNVGQGPSTSQSFSLSAANLSPAAGNISVTPPANYQVSLNNTTWSSTPVNVPYTAGTLAATNVYVRLAAGLSAGTYTGNIDLAGGGTTSTVSLSGQVAAPATHLAFANVPAGGFINQAITAFQVQALNFNEIVDPNYTGTITISLVSGPGTVNGTLAKAAVAGVASFDDISFSTPGTYVLQATATGLTSATSTGIVIVLPPAITGNLVPLYMSGATPNNTRVPMAFRATLDNLTPNATYRYTNQAVISTDGATTPGAGVLIFVNADGTFTRSTLGNLANPGEYGEFTTNASGSYTGWFMIEPSGNARFTAGNEVFMRIRLNNGAGGTSAAHYLTVAESIKVLQFSTDSTANDGTSIRATSTMQSGNFVAMFDNITGNGRPLFATSIEVTGIDYTTINQYPAFYKNFVSGVEGAFGGIIPNLNPAGVQLLREYSNANGGIVTSETSVDGIWGLTDTRDPHYGVDSTLVINLVPEMLAETVPAYIQGVNGNNEEAVPYAFRATITYLKPDHTYRYYNKVVLSTDSETSQGAGTTILVNSDGTFTRTTTTSMNTPGQYGTFTADNMGNYTGWFMVEPTGDARFTPGNQVHMRIMLNDGLNGTSVNAYVTSETAASVLDFGAAYNASTGTGVRGLSTATAGNFVYLYTDEAGAGQPLAGTSIETTGINFAGANNYVAFYTEEVEGVNGSWGSIVPNVLPDGIRRIEEHSAVTGNIVNIWTSSDGVWSNVDTRNPLGGAETELVINLLPTGNPAITAAPSTLTGFTYMEGNGPSQSQSYTLSAIDLEGTGNITVTAPADYSVSLDNSNFTATLEVSFADGTITGQPLTVYVRLNAGLPMGVYNDEVITHAGGGATANVTVSGEVTTSDIPGISQIILPMYMQGVNGTNATRLPLAFRATLNQLTPDATYRYFSKLVLATDADDFNGAGNTIFVNEDGTFARTTTTAMDTPGQYAEFTTDSTGQWTGWFIVEASGNDRFTPGNQVHVRINLNDGNEGTTVATRYTSEDAVTVINFGTEAAVYQGTGVHAVSNDQPGDFVFLYATATSDRPLYGAHIETSGIDFAATNVYAPFYIDSIAGVNGSWGAIVPNINPDGIQKIDVHANADGSLVKTYEQPSGIWLGVDTKDPNGGLDEVLYLNLKSINTSNISKLDAKVWYDGSGIVVEPGSNYKYNLTVVNVQGRTVISQELFGKSRVNTDVPSGMYIVTMRNANGIYSAKLFIR